MPASYRIRFHLIKNTTPFQCDFTMLTSASDGSFAEAFEISVNLIGSGIMSHFLDCLPTDVTLQALSVASVVANGGSTMGSATAVQPVNSAGTRTPSSGTGQTSNQDGPLVFYIPDVLPGERARVNKIFIPTVNESDAEDDLIGVSLTSAVGDFVLALQAGITVTSGAVSWVALVKISLVATIRGVISYGVRTFIASQRRRRPPHFG